MLRYGKPAGRRMGWWAVGLLIFFGNEFVANSILLRWEVPPTPLAALPHPYPCAVVLGGFTQVGRQPKDRTYLNQAADRLMHSILLYKKGHAQRLLLTGGTSSLTAVPEAEAANAARVAMLCAVSEAALTLEPNARNTRENALFSQHLLDSLGIRDTVLLVTSGFHARRAAGCFAKIGVPCRVFTTDARAQPPRRTPDVLLVPTAGALAKWDLLIHEWMGWVAYWVAGYV